MTGITKEALNPTSIAIYKGETDLLGKTAADLTDANFTIAKEADVGYKATGTLKY